MNRIQYGMLLVLGMCGISAQAAIMTIDTTAPSADNPESNLGNNKTTNIKNDNFARGNTFLMGDTGDANTQWGVTELSVRKQAEFAQHSTADKLSLWVFEWDQSNNGNDVTEWAKGDGITDGSPLDGTGMNNVLVNGDSFSLPATISDDSYIHFDYSGVGETLIMKENTTYAFILMYETDGTPTAGSINFGIHNDNANGYSEGVLLGSSGSSNVGVDSQDMAFWITAESIPEPATLGLICAAGLGLLFVRRRVIM